MTEQEWLTSKDPNAMLAILAGEDGRGNSVMPARTSDRKLRLVAQHLMGEVFYGPATGAGYPDHPEAFLRGFLTNGEHDERAAALFREVVGNPFAGDVPACRDCAGHARIQPPCPSCWRTGRYPTVTALAEATYEDCDFRRLPILADALEDAGCTDDAILRHLRGWERCPKCLDKKRVPDVKIMGRRIPVVELCCMEGRGWRQPRKPIQHALGCWALDLILGKE